MPSAEPATAPRTLQTARREMEICNACRYCEGFCPVFPAMMRKRAFSDADLNYFANLCHNCKGCFYACQYAPPHPFGVNLPQTLAQLRVETYERYAWPQPLAKAFRRNGVVLSAATAAAIAIVFGLLMTLRAGALGAITTGEGAFYRVVPWAVMSGAAGAALGFSLLAMAIGAARFWRETGGGVARGGAVAQALNAALTLRHLGGGHGGQDGCNDVDDGFSQMRRVCHHALFYGFGLCFASTLSAWIHDRFLHWAAPYPVASWPVLLGLVGGIGMAAGSAGLFCVKVASDPTPNARAVLGGDYALIGLLFAVAATGLLLLGVRETGAMGWTLALHLGLILALFLMLPYSKMVHGVYRSLALLRFAMEGGSAPAEEVETRASPAASVSPVREDQTP